MSKKARFSNFNQSPVICIFSQVTVVNTLIDLKLINLESKILKSEAHIKMFQPLTTRLPHKISQIRS